MPPPSTTIDINDKLGDRSRDAIARFHKTDEAFLTRLEAIPTTGFSDQDQLSHDLFILCVSSGRRIADYAFDRRHDT